MALGGSGSEGDEGREKRQGRAAGSGGDRGTKDRYHTLITALFIHRLKHISDRRVRDVFCS